VKLYLDTSVFNRPFDDQTQPRIWIETLSLALILQWLEAGGAELVNSAVLEFENSLNLLALRRDWMLRCLEQSSVYQFVDPPIRGRAEHLEKNHLGAIDALHIACAEEAGCDYFITCDDRLIKKRKLFTVKTMNSVDFVQKIIGVLP
jgi:predicted nucleic acid-binding protein